MNGETGKLIGNMPVDKKKAILTAITIFIISQTVQMPFPQIQQPA